MARGTICDDTGLRRLTAGATFSCVLFLAFLGVACTRPAAPAESPGVTGRQAAPAPLSSWDSLVREGAREGTVNIYASEISPAAVAELIDAFGKKFGINLEFTRGRPGEVIAKINSERRAGLFLTDVGHFGETTAAMEVKPLDVLVPLPDLLVLDEAKNPNNWVDGQLPFMDKERLILNFAANGIAHSIINTETVQESQIPSFMDILKPEWKGKIVMSDPGISGPAPNLFADLARTYGRDKITGILRQLLAQQPAIIRDQRLLIEWVAREKYKIGLGYSGAQLTHFIQAGAPVKRYSFKEPRRVNGGVSYIIVFARNPHPKATQVYINWLLTREGSSIWTRTMEFASLRKDVSREGLDPDSIPRPGDIYPDEDLFLLRGEMRKVASEIFAPLMK